MTKDDTSGPGPSISLAEYDAPGAGPSISLTEDDAPGAGPSISLTEDDVPGTKLLPPFERHTLSQLRRWLLCRAIVLPSSLKKDKVIVK